jgi:hypothetical protein
MRPGEPLLWGLCQFADPKRQAVEASRRSPLGKLNLAISSDARPVGL